MKHDINMDKDIMKTLLKNSIKFRALLFDNPESAKDLDDLFKKWPSPYEIKDMKFIWCYENLKEVLEEQLKSIENNNKFIDLLEMQGKLNDFLKDISNFIHKYNFGDEWAESIESLIINRWLFPPIHNLHIKETNKQKNNRVILILNPDTSIKDIKCAFPTIEKIQKSLWPNFKKENLTKNSIRNLNLIIQDLKEKGQKKYDIVDQTEYKQTDLDLALDIWPDLDDSDPKTNKKATNMISQIRKRHKDKTRNNT